MTSLIFNQLIFNLKKYCTSFSYLIIFAYFLTGCSNNQSSPNLEVSSPQSSLSINSPSPNSETTKANSLSTSLSTPSQTSSIIDPEQQFYSESTEIKVRCGETYNFQNFEINSQCPSDKDKDGRPDKSVVTFSFVNKSPQYSYLTFQGTISIFFGESLLDPDYKNYYYFKAIPTSGFYSTAKLNPKQVIKIDRTLNSYTDEFTFNLGIGKVKINSSESKILSLKCPNYGIVGDKVYGVTFNLSCSGAYARLDFENNATQARGVMIKQVQRGISWVYSQPNFEPRTYGGLSIKIPHKSRQEAGDYKAQIFYP